MKTATKTITAFTAAAIIATGAFAGSTKQAEAGWKNKAAGAFVVGTIIGAAASSHAHGYHRDRVVYVEDRECWYERRLVKVGYNTYKKRNVQVCD